MILCTLGVKLVRGRFGPVVVRSGRFGLVFRKTETDQKIHGPIGSGCLGFSVRSGQDHFTIFGPNKGGFGVFRSK